jgi:hypothetical protein
MKRLSILHIYKRYTSCYYWGMESVDETVQAFDKVISYLDGLMVLTPDRNLANVVNFLQDKKEELEE